MKLTDKDRKLLQQSIDHWQEDIINKFVGGNKIVWGGNAYVWNKSRDVSKHGGSHCPLCEEYALSNTECSYCPYRLFYFHPCDENVNGHWWKFTREFTKESAIAMRDALQAILDSDRKEIIQQIIRNNVVKKLDECVNSVGLRELIYIINNTYGTEYFEE